MLKLRQTILFLPADLEAYSCTNDFTYGRIFLAQCFTYFAKCFYILLSLNTNFKFDMSATIKATGANRVADKFKRVGTRLRLEVASASSEDAHLVKL